MAFLGWFGHYVLLFVVLAAVAGVGIFAGKKWSDRNAARKSVEAENIKE